MPRDPLTSPRASPPGRAKGVDGRSVAGACGRSAPRRPLPRRPSRAGLEHAREGGGAGVAQFVGYQRHGAPEREFALGDEHAVRSEEHTSETPVTNAHLVCRLLLEKKKKHTT